MASFAAISRNFSGAFYRLSTISAAISAGQRILASGTGVFQLEQVEV